MTTAYVDETWLREDDAAEVRAAAAVLRRRCADTWLLRFFMKRLDRIAADLDRLAGVS